MCTSLPSNARLTVPAAAPPPLPNPPTDTLKSAAKEGAAAVKRANGKAAPKLRGSVWSAESSAALKAVGAYSSRKKGDGWTFSRAPTHGEQQRMQCAVL